MTSSLINAASETNATRLRPARNARQKQITEAGIPDQVIRQMCEGTEPQARQAFALVFDYYQPRVTTYLKKLGTHPDDAQELSQETLLTAWSKRGQYDSGKSAFCTWLYAIARSRRLDFIRKQQADCRNSAHAESDTVGLLYDPDASRFFTPSKAWHLDQIRQLIRNALEILKQKGTAQAEQAIAMEMMYFEGKDQVVIQAESGWPLGTVKSRLRLGKKNLLEILQAMTGLSPDQLHCLFGE